MQQRGGQESRSPEAVPELGQNGLSQGSGEVHNIRAARKVEAAMCRGSNTLKTNMKETRHEQYV